MSTPVTLCGVAKVLEELHMEKFSQLKHFLACNPRTSASTLIRLSSSPVERVRVRVAENKSCPPEILILLAHDSAPDVRAAVACNKGLPVASLKELITDESPDVRFRIASDAVMPVEVIDRLMTDVNPYVQARAVKTFKRMEQDWNERIVRVSDPTANSHGR